METRRELPVQGVSEKTIRRHVGLGIEQPMAAGSRHGGRRRWRGDDQSREGERPVRSRWADPARSTGTGMLLDLDGGGTWGKSGRPDLAGEPAWASGPEKSGGAGVGFRAGENGEPAWASGLENMEEPASSSRSGGGRRSAGVTRRWRRSCELQDRVVWWRVWGVLWNRVGLGFRGRKEQGRGEVSCEVLGFRRKKEKRGREERGNGKI